MSHVRCMATVSGKALSIRSSGNTERRCQRVGWARVGEGYYCSQHAAKLRADHERIVARIRAIPPRPIE